MNKLKKLIPILCCCFSICSCQKAILSNFRKDLTYGMSKQAKKDWEFYHAIYRYEWDYDAAKQMLESGANPDYCNGENGWVDSNPLMIMANSLLSSYMLKYMSDPAEKILPDADSRMIKLLYSHNADFTKYPYVWKRIVLFNDDAYLKRYDGKKISDEQMEDERKSMYIDDANRVLQVLLECGADPNKKGHPFPFSYEAVIERRIKDEKANEYFNSAEATTPLYEAIKKGIEWESQVDLLLQYGATLDESCLKAAEESGDAAMVEKINALYIARPSN